MKSRRINKRIGLAILIAGVGSGISLTASADTCRSYQWPSQGCAVPTADYVKEAEPCHYYQWRPAYCKSKKISYNVVPEPVYETITIGDMYFDFDSAELRDSGKRELDRLVSKLSDNPNLSVKIVGYTDSVGTETYNEKLSKERAMSVASYIKSRGINESRISTSAGGETNPVATNDTVAGRQQNRRVEIGTR